MAEEVGDAHAPPIAPEWNTHLKNEKGNAGALVVLESKGTWAHAGYHLTASTAGPPLLSLPYAIASLGWGPGMLVLSVAAVVSFYSFYSLSRVMDNMEKQGKRFLRFRDLVNDILGPRWSYYMIGPLQLVVCFVTVISCILLGGQSMKAMYVAVDAMGSLKLYEFIIIFGTLTLLLSQLPSFHSLRHINFFSILLCMGYTICAVSGSIVSGHSSSAPPKKYEVLGTPIHKAFSVFNAISIIITAYGNAIIVEIQATLSPPVTGKMVRGLMICYAVTLVTFFSVAVSGYWAFGNASNGIIFNNMFSQRGESFIPRWLFFTGYALVFLQLIVAAVIYSQPTFEILEGMVGDVNKGRFSRRNLLPRLAIRSLFIAFATFLASMLPFFADINAVLGSLGFVPLSIILPLLFYNMVFKPRVWTRAFWVNYSIVSASIIVAAVGCVASVRQVCLDARTYKLFANI
eukprot:c20705_g1_i1 orf=179-1555(+)